MKRIDKIKALDSCKLASYINDSVSNQCDFCGRDKDDRFRCGSTADCIQGITDWLQQEYEL